MLQRTSKLFIGKDINRDEQCVDGATIATIIASTGLADGEILVLDKNFKVAPIDVDSEDTDVIYICQGTGETFDYTNEAGTTVAGARKVKISNPIAGADVITYGGKAYTAKAEKTASVDLTGLVPVVGTEYIVRIVYKDINEHPGQFTQTYRVVSNTITLDTLGAAIAAKINAHKGARVTATYTDGTDILLLTAKAIPSSTGSLADIDKFSMVDFEVFFLYVDTKGNWQTIPSTVTTVTYVGPTYGSGNWEQIRDLEKADLPYTGPRNTMRFPVIAPDAGTVKSACYDLITIEHNTEYLSPDNQYSKKAPLTTNIALTTASTGINAGTQSADIITRLNSFFGSFGFASVTV